MKPKTGWMDSTCFDHELGNALGGEKVYANKEDCESHHPCIAASKGETIECRVVRVYVFDADEYDTQKSSFCCVHPSESHFVATDGWTVCKDCGCVTRPGSLRLDYRRASARTPVHGAEKVV